MTLLLVPSERAASWSGQLLSPLEVRGDSACDSMLCVPRDSLALRLPSDSSGTAFLREAAFLLSAAGRHRAAVAVLEDGARRLGEDPLLRLLEADEFFADGSFENALGLNYAMERRFPQERERFLGQRLRFFQALGMTHEARQVEAALRPDHPTFLRPSWSGWYSFAMEDSRIHYDPVRSRVWELASEITRGSPPAAASGNLDTMRSYGRTKVHSAGASWNWREGAEAMRLEPWTRAVLDAGADTLTQWGAGVRLGFSRSFASGSLGLSAGLGRIAYFPNGMRNDATLGASWSRYAERGYWRVSASASRSASLSQEGGAVVRYSQGNLGISGRKDLPHGVSLSGSLGLGALLGPESRSMDSVAKVVTVSGMRDTVLYLKDLKTLPSWLSIYDGKGNAWNPGFRGIYGVPTTVEGVPFVGVTPTSNWGPSLEATLSWSPVSRVTLAAGGGISWRVWFETTRWSIALLGKNASGDTLTLWRDRETGSWYLMEPHTAQSNDIDRRVLPFETFERRREDLDLSGTLSASLDLGKMGSVTASWSAEANWSTIGDKDSDENAWDSRAFSLQWNVSL